MHNIFCLLSDTAHGFITWLYWSKINPLTGLRDELPTRDEYIHQYPQYVKKEHLYCRYCGFSRLLDVGLASYTDFRRTTFCRDCKHILFKEDL